MAHIESLGSSVLDESKSFFQAANGCVQRQNFGSQGGEKQINATAANAWAGRCSLFNSHRHGTHLPYGSAAQADDWSEAT
jgi:hypothetical protein